MRQRLAAGLILVVAGLSVSAGVAARSPGGDTAPSPQTGAGPAPAWEPVVWRRSKAVGKPWRGQLVRAVKLPAYGPDWFTWDWALQTVPNRTWRRYGHDRLVRMLIRVLADYRAAHPKAPRVGIADLSRPKGGNFGRRFGGLGHKSHQNGLDVDLLYPRRDRQELPPESVRQIDRRLSQDLLDRFVRAGVEKAFVGPGLRLRGRRAVVVPLYNHDDHLHLRIRPRRGGR
jgi:murein endopeptidase